MVTNVIMRPVYNRPEMLALSIEYEKAARDYFGDTSSITTVFLVEYGAPSAIFELIDSYEFKKVVVQRERKMGLSINILEGFKFAFSLADSFVIHLEDDVLLHKTYFNYMKILLTMDEIKPFSVLSPFDFKNGEDVNAVRKAHHYAALAPLINKEFYDKYILKCSNDDYYRNSLNFVVALGERYKDFWGPDGYKYKGTATHYEQAGLINRLVDCAMIDFKAHVIQPNINRQLHIGFYGKNRPGGSIPGNTFEERLSNLREIIKSSDKMYELSATKCYNDYLTWSPRLDEWDGTLRLI